MRVMSLKQFPGFGWVSALGVVQGVQGAPPPPPQGRSLLPRPREGVVRVQTVSDRLDVALRGWGGQRLTRIKPAPEQPRGNARAVKTGLMALAPEERASSPYAIYPLLTGPR